MRPDPKHLDSCNLPKSTFGSQYFRAVAKVNQQANDYKIFKIINCVNLDDSKFRDTKVNFFSVLQINQMNCPVFPFM
ncbi:hypothetical protein BpHYR1_041321 [Brachionus plicatilis]|uniref:Uncharacterized protein n=1 Tax=Brachionus plicatilis TaxID=10195 RepID=A0A3M7Q457_BRAPC|nr:hypothetical protein BpHYR1_041321 [Brachionus plicatilis]